MLNVENVLNALPKENQPNNYQDYNTDHNFSDVLEFCGNIIRKKHIIRFADGQEKEFSFDEQGE